MPAPTTRKMSDRHEQDLVVVLGGERTRNSGAVWSDQSDGHQTGLDQHYTFAWDGKSTLGLSIGVTRKMWAKLEEQARGLEPLLPLRFYRDSRLTEVDVDLAAVDLELFAQILQDANAYRRMEEFGCAGGIHRFGELESGSVPGMMVRNGPCEGCGLSPYDAGQPNDPDQEV